MPILPPPREGDILTVKSRTIEFSLWPTKRTTKRYGLNTRIFATDPWNIIKDSIRKRCKSVSTKKQALAFFEQARDYFVAASSAGITAAQPVLLYYSFLNLAKSFSLTTGQRTSYDQAFHGLKERKHSGNREFIDAYLEVVPSSSTHINIFDDFTKALGYSSLGSINLDIIKLMPQILQGHRIWALAKSEKERFIAIEKIEFRKNPSRKEIWICLYLAEDDVKRIGYTHSNILTDGGLSSSFREVRNPNSESARKLLKIESIVPMYYSHRPSDKLKSLVDSVKRDIWVNVLSTPPYRKYYLYPSPNSELNHRLPQILSVYAIFYYFSSLTRYRPNAFEEIVNGELGGFIEEVFTNVPKQFLYIMASEFAKSQVTRAAIVN